MARLRLAIALAAAAASIAVSAQTYRNPLDLRLPDGTPVQSCADPTMLQGQRPGDAKWTLICTQDPLHDRDRDAQGRLRFRRLPTFHSDDLVHWHYQGEALDAPPPQAVPDAGAWAPELAYADGHYLLYYAITDVADAYSPEPGCRSDSAIGVALADSPSGPWRVQPDLVVPPRRAGAGCAFHWTIDPDLVVTPEGRKWLFYGSYGGGIVAQPLDAAGLHAQGRPVQIAPSDRYEGAEVVFRDGWYYLFASTANCCNGALTGYALFVGRSREVTGPYVDDQGQPLLAARSGGTPVIVQNGNRWVGPGHNSVFRTDDGRWWTVYHAVDRDQPQWTGSPLTRRPALMDELVWVDGWPRLAHSAGPSDAPVPAPGAAEPPVLLAPAWTPDDHGPWLWVDEFGGDGLDPRWHTVRAWPAPPSVHDALLHLATANGDLHLDENDAPLLVRDLPDEPDLVVQARVALGVPPEGEVPHFVQAGFAILGNDDAYLKLVHVAIHGTRQTEFGIEVPPHGSAPRYGNTVIGPPGDWTDLCLHLQRNGPRVVATAYTRAEGGRWVRGGTWVHTQLGPKLRIALLAMGGAGHEARFAHVRVSRGPAALH
jgi:arabinan endo-1,5-alpha-L-arabinosidase